MVKEPEENYYILKKSSAVIVCQAKNAAEITFSCKGTQIPPSSVETKDVSDIDVELIQAEIEVTRADLQNSGDESPFWCECSAVDVDGQVVATSRKGFVSVACKYLDLCTIFICSGNTYLMQSIIIINYNFLIFDQSKTGLNSLKIEWHELRMNPQNKQHSQILLVFVLFRFSFIILLMSA